MAALLAAHPVPAQVLGYDCTFDMICVERLSCQPSELGVTVKPAPDKTATLATGGRVLEARTIVDPSLEARSFVTALEFNSIHLLTIFQDGAARFTIHTPVQDLQSMTHFGRCEIAP